jgi:hypothetical protein
MGFLLPTLQIERLGFSTSSAAIVTAVVTMVNVAGNVGAGWLLQCGVSRVVLIVSATLSMALCTVGIFVDGVPDIARVVLAGLYSAATGLLMQVSNFGALVGPPITGALVSAGGWPAAAWMTSLALTIAAVAGGFLHGRERRRLAA